MSLFDDFSRFLETRLDEFLKNNPHLELQALLDKLESQEKDTLRLIASLQLQEKNLQDQILSLAQDIQTWHSRIKKAQAAGRLDLAQAAQEREASLLRQGNQLWGQMEGVKQNIVQSKELLVQIQQRRKEVKAKAAEAKSAQAKTATKANSDTTGWNQGASYNNYDRFNDPLEEVFQNWEIKDELEQMKRNLGR